MGRSASNDYVLGHANDELVRLMAQGRLFGELTEQLLRAAGIEPGMRVLDAGCGAGDVSFLVASLVGPGGTVIGVDRSPEAVALATQRAAAAGLRNVLFRTQDLHELQLDQPVDAIVGRLVLMYFMQPASLLRRMLECLRPNGLVVFHEFDVDCATSEPRVPLYELSISRIAETLRRAQAHPRMGLVLPQTFGMAGLPPPQTIAHTRISTGEDSGLFQQIAGVTRTLLQAMEKLGVATAADVDVDTLAQRLEQETSRHDATVVAPLFIGAWSRKGQVDRAA